jgi:hypothetical protein
MGAASSSTVQNPALLARRDMLNSIFAATPLLLLLAAPGPTPEPPVDWSRAAEMVQQHVTIHVPRITVTSSATFILRRPAPVRMIEKKANDCVKIDKISGFGVSGNDSVDLVLNDGKLLRVKLGDDCRALGFYNGFYVKPTSDKKICAGRDAFRSRSGRSCSVASFKTLTPAR